MMYICTIYRQRMVVKVILTVMKHQLRGSLPLASNNNNNNNIPTKSGHYTNYLIKIKELGET